MWTPPKPKSQQPGIRIGSTPFKASKPMRSKGPKKPKPPKVDRQKKKNCHQQAYREWLRLLPRDKRTGAYNWDPRIHPSFATFKARYYASHPECR